MNTELYETLFDMLLRSGLSKRAFCEKYGIPRAWFIEFINPEKPFRPLLIQTQGLLLNQLGIPYKMTEAYNNEIKAQRQSEKQKDVI